MPWAAHDNCERSSSERLSFEYVRTDRRWASASSTLISLRNRGGGRRTVSAERRTVESCERRLHMNHRPVSNVSFANIMEMTIKQSQPSCHGRRREVWSELSLPGLTFRFQYILTDLLVGRTFKLLDESPGKSRFDVHQCIDKEQILVAETLPTLAYDRFNGRFSDTNKCETAEHYEHGVKTLLHGNKQRINGAGILRISQAKSATPFDDFVAFRSWIDSCQEQLEGPFPAYPPQRHSRPEAIQQFLFSTSSGSHRFHKETCRILVRSTLNIYRPDECVNHVIVIRFYQRLIPRLSCIPRDGWFVEQRKHQIPVHVVSHKNDHILFFVTYVGRRL